MATPARHRRASSTLATALNGSGGAPEWIEVIPRGPEIVGRDGRSWVLREPARVVADSEKHAPLHVDYEHASETVAPKGGEAPAAGWITDLDVRDGAIWARVDWTPRAGAMVQNREYRFVSPVFLYDTTTREVLSLVSVALTNRPNLELAALNTKGDPEPSPQPKDTQMTPEQMKALCKKLGLKDEASGDAILSAVEGVLDEKATALNAAQTPSLDKFVPRADFDALKAKADTAQAALNTIETERTEKAIADAVDGAVTAGKVAPASKDYYVAMCRKGGLDDFKKFVDSAPVLVGASGLDKKAADPAGNGALSDAERALCSAMGLTEESFKKAKAA